LVVTLGQEALDAVRGVADHVADVQAQLTHDGHYGEAGSVIIDGHQL
jgi:hypothetical protein